MRIHFLTNEIKDWTGGSVYDGMLYRKLIDRFGDDVKLIDYSSFGDEFAFFKRDFLHYGLCFRKHAKELLDCDYLILNTSMYPKFLLFPRNVLKKRHCRIIGITHHLDYMSYYDRTRGIRKKLLISLLRSCDFVISSGRYTVDCLKTFGMDDRVRLLEAYLDKTLHVSGRKKEKLICFVGTVEPRKGLDYGIRAFDEFHRTHPEYRFEIAGSFMNGDPLDEYCQSLLQFTSELESKDQISFLGRIDENQKRELYERAQIFLFPSLLEGYGWVMVEAMSYSMPVVAFDNSAMPYTVNETNGELVPNKDVHAMAEALSRLADDTKLYERLSAGAVQTVAGLPDRDEIDRKFEDFFDQMEARTI